MPCDSIITNTVDMPKMHKRLRRAALSAAGFTDITEYQDGAVVDFTHQGERYRLANGRLTGLDGQSERQVGAVADLLKKHYSHQVVRYTAQRNGWTVKQIAADRYIAVKK